MHRTHAQQHARCATIWKNPWPKPNIQRLPDRGPDESSCFHCQTWIQGLSHLPRTTAAEISGTGFFFLNIFSWPPSAPAPSEKLRREPSEQPTSNSTLWLALLPVTGLHGLAVMSEASVLLTSSDIQWLVMLATDLSSAARGCLGVEVT